MVNSTNLSNIYNNSGHVYIMSTFFQNKNSIGKLIHVGAGHGAELNDYVRQNFTEIILLEPTPKVFKSLENKIAKITSTNERNITTITALNSALSDKSEEQEFYVTKPHRYSSLYKTDKLKTLFQNLKTEQEITLKAITFPELLQKANLDESKKNALVLEINGAEYNVLAHATKNDLMQFSSIVVQHAKNNYFNQPKISKDIIALMEEKGFQLSFEANSDIAFNNLVFRKDENAFKLVELTNKTEQQTAIITELEAQLKATKEASDAKVVEAEELNKNHTTQIAELDNALKASNGAKASEANRANAAEELNKKHATKIAELNNALKAGNEAKANEANRANAAEELNKKHAIKIAELDNALKAGNEAKANEANRANAAEELNKEHATKIAELESYNKNLETKIVELESDKQELIKRQTMLDTEIIKVEAQLELVKDVVLREKAF